MNPKFLVVIVWSAQCHRGVEMTECANIDDARFYLRTERLQGTRTIEQAYIAEVVTKVVGDLRGRDKE